MLIGAHVPTVGGLDTAIKNGKNIGAEALQIFPSAPLQWKIRGWDDEACAKFKTDWQKDFKQVVFHGIYLTNLASATSENLEKTKKALIDTLNLSVKIGVAGTIFHPGSYANSEFGLKDQVKSVIKEILVATPKESKLIFENSSGSTIGGKLEDLALLMEMSNDQSRVGVCLDTCHAFAAGYDIRTEETYNNYISQVDKTVGLNNVFAWHLNDSKFGLAEKRDRHENIGAGKLGVAPFGYIVNDVRFKDIVGYLEVPGFDKSGPDKKNVDILKKLRN